MRQQSCARTATSIAVSASAVVHEAEIATTRSWSPGSTDSIDDPVANCSSSMYAGTLTNRSTAFSTAAPNAARREGLRHSLTGSGQYGRGSSGSVGAGQGSSGGPGLVDLGRHQQIVQRSTLGEAVAHELDSLEVFSSSRRTR